MKFVSPQNRRQTPTDKNNWGPRFGLAYNITTNTVVRAAYGITFAPSAMQASGPTGASGMDGFNSSSTPISLLSKMFRRPVSAH